MFRWSLIARRVPGRTDNQVKNYWNSHLRKKLGIKEKNLKRVDSCQSSKQVKLSDQLAAAMDPSAGAGAGAGATSGTMDIAVDQSSSQVQQATDHQVLNTTQESVIISNPFWIPDDDLELSTLTMIDYFDEYSSFDLA